MTNNNNVFKHVKYIHLDKITINVIKHVKYKYVQTCEIYFS